MASTGQVALVERNDVHKACKSMETLVNVLNDYCEAAGAIASLEKKLAKALRDSAGLKATGDVAANALNASATIFEVLADINGKFAKVADKEYDYVSTEVKKWFKKLAKEEKAHGEKIANADAKIKQAGQAYEKKVKKNPRDASDEHARYINLITTLGPEITQEKYNHALTVTQRHTATTYTLAGCLSRIADAEWLKTCEGVRRFSPTIGPLGEFRALCEGGWVGPMPEGLPDTDDPQQQSGGLDKPTSDRTDEESPTISQEVLRDTPRRRPKTPIETQHLGPPQHEPNPRSRSPSNSPGHLHPYNTQPSQPQRPYSPSSDGHEQPHFDFPRPLIDMQTGSVRSLSAFPSPPTHVPMPHIPRAQTVSVSTQPFPLLGRVITSSPAPEGGDEEGPQSSRAPPPTEVRGGESVRSSPEQAYRNPAVDQSPPARVEEPQPPPQSTPTIHQSPTSSPVISSPAITRRTSLYESRQGEDRDFGVRRSMDSPGAKPPPPSAAETNRIRSVERTDTGGSNGSIVAAMRSRYTGGSGNISAQQKDVPKLPLPLSVSEMAARYQPIDGPTSPSRARAMSPTQSSQQRQLPTPQPSEMAKHSPSSPPPGDEELNRHRRQRLDEIAEQELHDRERHLRDREHHIETQTQELERERARFYSNRDTPDPSASYTNVSQTRGYQPRERRSSQMESGYTHSTTNSTRPQPYYANSHMTMPNPPHMQHSHSQPQPSRDTRDLQPPSSPSHPRPSSRPSSRPPSRLESANHSSRPSITSYQQLSSPVDSPRGAAPPFPQPSHVQPQPNAFRTDKPKGGWMRRLSMPVVSNAFSSDSKKGSGNVGISSKTMFAVDGKKNTSSTNLRLGAGMVGGAGVSEDGRLSTRR